MFEKPPNQPTNKTAEDTKGAPIDLSKFAAPEDFKPEVFIFVPFLLKSANHYEGKGHEAKTKAKRHMRLSVQYALRQSFASGYPQIEWPVQAVVRPQHRKGSRRRDVTNYWPSWKSAEDALVDLKLLPGDTGNWMRAVQIIAPLMEKQEQDGLTIWLRPSEIEI